jgi:hypothetical protein
MMRAVIWTVGVHRTCPLVSNLAKNRCLLFTSRTECRNNLAPTYSPRQADIWSLGIVLINMLYHHNPWSDTSLIPEHACPSFIRYREIILGERDGRPEEFFRSRFVGMSEPIASFLVKRVFCFLPVGEEAHSKRKAGGQRITAEEFGHWAKKLPELFGKSGAGFGKRDEFLVTPLNAPPKRSIFCAASPTMY